jgi:lipopolysaccharide heptosyltransferase I
MTETVRRVVEATERPRIALIRLGAMGDCVYAFPLVTALKASIPGARVTWIVEEEHRDVPALHPGVDDLIVVETRRWRREARAGRLGAVVAGIAAVRARSRSAAFDLALDAQGLLKSGAIAWFTAAPVRVGFPWADCREGWSSLFTTHRVDPDPDAHIVHKNLSLLAPLGIRVEVPEFGIRVPDRAAAAVASLLRERGIRAADRLVAMHPGGGHPCKRWASGRFAEVADQLQRRHGVRALLTCGPGEEGIVAEVASRMRTRATAVPPLPVAVLAALLARCDLAIAGDTGPLHLAAALGCATVAIYGPSDPVRVAPVGSRHRVLKQPCACGWRPGIHFNRRCPDVPCLDAVSASDVVAAATALLAGGPGAPAAVPTPRPATDWC